MKMEYDYEIDGFQGLLPTIQNEGTTREYNVLVSYNFMRHFEDLVRGVNPLQPLYDLLLSKSFNPYEGKINSHPLDIMLHTRAKAHAYKQNRRLKAYIKLEESFYDKY